MENVLRHHFIKQSTINHLGGGWSKKEKKNIHSVVQFIFPLFAQEAAEGKMAAMKMLAGNCKKSSVEMFTGTSQHSGENPWRELNPTYTPFILGIFGSAFFTLRVGARVSHSISECVFMLDPWKFVPILPPFS